MSAATTTGAVTSTRSPFALLRDAEQAEEVLILTYAANLEFFERFALSEARGLQAATTLISDARMVSLDPETVHGAGLRYLDARAICPGHTAFHPKLLVIAGRDRSTIAVGSGNLTLAGWHGNEELWTYFHASAERGPRTVAQVATFLRKLADAPIQLSAEAPAAIAKTCELRRVRHRRPHRPARRVRPPPGPQRPRRRRGAHDRRPSRLRTTASRRGRDSPTRQSPRSGQSQIDEASSCRHQLVDPRRRSPAPASPSRTEARRAPGARLVLVPCERRRPCAPVLAVVSKQVPTADARGVCQPDCASSMGR